MFGSKTWVKVHWLFVLLTCVTVIGGFAVIFVGVDGISQLYEVCASVCVKCYLNALRSFWPNFSVFL